MLMFGLIFLGGSEKWCRFGTLLGQFNVQKFMSSVTGSVETPNSVSSWLQTIGKHLQNHSLYALGFSSELMLTPDDTLLLSLDSYTFGDNKKPRKKAILHHKVYNASLSFYAFFNCS